MVIYAALIAIQSKMEKWLKEYLQSYLRTNRPDDAKTQKMHGFRSTNLTWHFNVQFTTKPNQNVKFYLIWIDEIAKTTKQQLHSINVFRQ